MRTSAQMLLAARRRAGLTQATLASRAGVPVSVVSAYENGRREPGADTFLRLVRAADAVVDVETDTPAHRRSAAQLELVCAMAMALPVRPAGPLEFPPFRTLLTA